MSINKNTSKIRYEFDETNNLTYIFPQNRLVSICLFNESEKDEAILCNSIAVVAEKNGLDQNELFHIFPAILRMLKSDIKWAKNIETKKEIIVDNMLQWWQNKSDKEQYDLREKYPQFCGINNKVYYSEIFKAEMSGGFCKQSKSEKIINWWFDIGPDERIRLIEKYPQCKVGDQVNFVEIYEKEFPNDK